MTENNENLEEKSPQAVPVKEYLRNKKGIDKIKLNLNKTNKEGTNKSVSPQAQTPKEVREANRKKVDLSVSPQAQTPKEVREANRKKVDLSKPQQIQTPEHTEKTNKRQTPPQAQAIEKVIKINRNRKKAKLPIYLENEFLKILNEKNKTIEKEIDNAFSLGKSNTMELK